ncbi:hypothetical protein DL93DRAFT_1213080 [Clavulina sp. PMI_390]|nr:hypothetical protein DL93DRAFT_1213080 [Clavulina sp. PMI_390]
MANIGSLAVEILQHIFTLATPDMGVLRPDKYSPITNSTPHSICSIDAPGHRRHLNSALTISYICSQWRSIALSMGKLWSYIIVKLPSPSRLDILAFRWQVHRAGDFPLDLEFDVCTIRRVDWNTSSPLLNLVLAVIPRCRSLLFLVIPRSFYSHLFPLHGPLPILKNLSIRITKSAGQGELPPIFNDTTTAPALNRLHFSCVVDYCHVPSLQNIRSPLLTYLRVTIIEIHQFPNFLEFLSQCTSLVYLGFPLTEHRGSFIYPPHPIVLPQLQFLHVGDCELHRLLIVPALRSLLCHSYVGLMDQSGNMPPIRTLVLSVADDVLATQQQWSPPVWTRNLEFLSFPLNWGAYPISSLRTALCAHCSSVDPDSSAVSSPNWAHFPHLTRLELHSLNSWVMIARTERIVDDLIAILETRAELHIRVRRDVVSRDGKDWDNLSARFAGRLLATQ